MKLKKNDTVKIITGKDKGKNGKILETLPKKGRVLVEGVNLYKKHVRPKNTAEKGQIITISRSINASNVMIICPACGKNAKIGYKIEGEKKSRICKKCKATI